MSLSVLAAALVLACQPAIVVSGSRLLCEGRLVQLAGLRAEGPEATEALRQMVGREPTVCRSEGEQPKGLVVARCWARGVDLGCALQRSGKAVRADARRPACR